MFLKYFILFSALCFIPYIPPDRKKKKNSSSYDEAHDSNSQIKRTMQKNHVVLWIIILVFTADYFSLWNSLFQFVSFIFHSLFKIPKAKLHNMLSFQEALSPFWMGLSFPEEVTQIRSSEMYFVTLFLSESKTSTFPRTTFEIEDKNLNANKCFPI